MINSFVALDLETTGVSVAYDQIIEIGAIKVVDDTECETFSMFINPKMKIPDKITQITGINDEMVKDANYIEDVLDELLNFIGDLPLLGHNIIFDYSFIKMACVKCGREFNKDGIDTLKLARTFLVDCPSKKLENLCQYLDINPGHSHRATDDARSAWFLYRKINEISNGDEKLDKVSKLEYSVKKKSPITPAQVRYLTGLIKKHHIESDIQISSLSKNDASRMIDQILSTYGMDS